VDGASLAAFRVGLGLLMLWQAMEYLLGGRLERYFVHASFHFKYPGLGWLEPLPEAWMRALFWLLAAAAVGIALGWHYRLSAAIFTLIHGYQFLLDEASYNNHDYLIALLGLLMTVVPAHGTFSLDARRRPAVASEVIPAWSLWLLRFQLAMPYTYGGLAKLDADWLLRAQPMKIWLAHPGPGEWRIGLFREPWAAYFFSWSGMVLDLLVVPALLWRKTRRFAVAVLIAFHLLNSQLFEIGVFPWLMICATVLFVEPDWPRRAGLLPRRRGPEAAKLTVSKGPPSAAARAGAALLAAYVGLQLLVPFRHLLYPGDVDWTEEGHHFSWRMKLRDKRGELRFLAIDPATRSAVVLTGVESVLTRRQQLAMHHDPDMIRQFAHLLAQGFRERGQGDMEIRVASSISLNGLPPQALVDPEVDLGSEPASPAPADWIVPLRTASSPTP
jgi:vitamin K-dependent gamma-carboxylase